MNAQLIYGLFLCMGLLLIGCQAGTQDENLVTPLWDRYTLQFNGPTLEETPETFLDYRLQVRFVHSSSGRDYDVPGFFAADGNAAETSATAGNTWMVHFSPDRLGEWTYEVQFRKGQGVALETDSQAGESAGHFDGQTGRFKVVPATSGLPLNSLKRKGMLKYRGGHYLQYAGTGEYFLKMGAGSPENLLAYEDFDGTYDRGGTHFPALGENQIHGFRFHDRDWVSGDPVWKDSLGTELIGAINYIAEKGLNAAYFLVMNVEGDGDDIWPWVAPDQREVFDVSKLAQWEIVMDHMDAKGILKDILLSETENENLFEALDGGDFAPTRKLYYRELIARFGHHLGIVWNLGEENGHDPDTGKLPFKLPNTDEQRKNFSAYIRAIDPYDHPIVVHNWPGDEELLFGPLLGYAAIEGISLQEADDYYDKVLQWRNASAIAGKKWLIAVDEPLGWEFGLRPDAEDPEHDIPRKEVLWPTLFAGGMGVDWYFGWQNNAPTSDLSNEDWRSREAMWIQSKIALDFFKDYIPIDKMAPANHLSGGPGVLVLGGTGDLYAVYVKEAAEVLLDLGDSGLFYNVQWYHPKEGGDPRHGSITQVQALGGRVSIGRPPGEGDWAAIVQRVLE
jgi:hypothetical protein